jgi:hypothetical protein
MDMIFFGDLISKESIAPPPDKMPDKDLLRFSGR